MAHGSVVMGVDVGGPRKGFDVALLEDGRVELRARLTVADVLEWATRSRPRVIAIDSPRRWAPAGARSREDERDLVRAGICNIRWTPAEASANATRAAGSAYYDWIFSGLALYAALADGPWTVIECFPTASWTRWAGRRGSRRRSTWTREALPGLGVHGVPARTNQDQRDAVAAAVTAREFLAGSTEAFGDIHVPRGR